MTARLAPAAVSNRVWRVPATGRDRRSPAGAIACAPPGRAGGSSKTSCSKIGALDSLQALARFDAEFLHQRPACRPVDSQRLRLPPAPVQSDHQLLMQPLAQRVHGDDASSSLTTAA